MKPIYIIFLLLSAQIFNASGQDKVKSIKPPLREMETDRPDVSESPHTVDAGHFQFETDLLRIETQHLENSDQQEYLINQANLKFGITRSTAIQLSVQSYSFTRETAEDGTVEKKHGFGDLTLRVKQSLLGNDDGQLAIAVLPYVKFPTSRADRESQY